MPWVAGLAAAGASLVGGYMNYKASKDQQKAAAAGQSGQMDLVREQMRNQNVAAREGIDYIQGGADDAAGAINSGYFDANKTLWNQYTRANADLVGQTDLARGALTKGYEDAIGSVRGARGDISDYSNQAASALGSAYAGAQGNLGQVAGLRGYANQAATGINPYDVAGQYSNRADQLLNGGLEAGFQTDPGYQFRREQGEQAIMRQAAAGGGRVSGATMKALSEYNQGLASQEYGNYAQRKMALAGAADSGQLAALTNQAARTDQAALATNANQMALGQMGYGALGQMANMQTMYGQNMANLYGQTGAQLAGLNQYEAELEQQRGQGLAGIHSMLGQTQYAGRNQIGGQAAANSIGQGTALSNLYYGSGVASASALTGGAAGSGQIAMNALPGMMAGVPYAGGGYTAAGNAFNSAAQNGLAAYMMMQAGR